MTKIIYRNKGLFYYRSNIAKDYELYRHVNEKLLKQYELTMPLSSSSISLQMKVEGANVHNEEDNMHNEEACETLNALITNTVSEHIGSYLDSGVNIDEGNRAVKNISNLVSSTFDSHVISDIGSFGGMYDLKYITEACLNPVLVTSIDGVGTKGIFSVEHYELDGFEMLGEDIVNHSINDILVQGAVPLFFTDYFASNVLNCDELYYFVKGVTTACKASDCVLIGGETAEMPNTYESGRHDIVGSIVGIVDKNEIINGKKNVKAGDVMVSLQSSGPHTNGFSLIRKIYNRNKSKFTPDMIENLSKPHRSYLYEYSKILEEDVNIHGMAHITGGGLLENIRRTVPDNLIVNITDLEYSTIFKQIQEIGNIPSKEMERVFNCGVGMVFIVEEKDAKIICGLFDDAKIIGNII